MDDPAVKDVLDRVREHVADLPGISGLALGGSHASGTSDLSSDIDIGLYYDPAKRPDFDVLVKVFSELDDRGRPDGYGTYGEWGPWINGGAWLQMSGLRVDILLRNVDRTRVVLQDCTAGRVDIHYQVGHPHGFCSASYAGEINQNKLFLDRDGTLAALRRLTDPYPAALATALVDTFSWESGFSLATASTAAARGDVAYTTGCAFRSVACMTQVLFAAEHRYLTNEKGSVKRASGFSVAPHGFADRVAEALGTLSAHPADLKATLADLAGLHQDVLRSIGRN